MRKLLPRNLRSRLILSFGVLIFFTLFLAGVTTIFLLREEQERDARERVGLLAIPVAQRAAVLEALGLRLNDIQEVLQQEYPAVRLLLIDDAANVVADTGGTMRGSQVSGLISDTSVPLNGRGYRTQTWNDDGEDWLLFAAPQGVLTTPNGSIGYVPSFRAIIAVPASDISANWRELGTRLFFAGGVAFLVSVVAASLLARGVTQPLRNVATASEEMAAGRYDQQLPSYSDSDVNRLATAFNHMAQQVGLSNRTLREFLANVSHELKTPLTSIQGFSQAMADGTLQQREDYIEAGKIINDEAMRMRGLVDDLLYISQVEAGEVVMHLDDVNVEQLLAATRERFAFRAEQGKIDLRAEARPAPMIRVDVRRLEQALANIVDNAVRHTPAGGRITLRAGSVGNGVEIAVHNTGAVIPAEALPHIFDRFYQVNPNQSRVDGNSGLGLAITREIVEMHDGTVTATSSESEGTEFKITLPVVPELNA